MFPSCPQNRPTLLPTNLLKPWLAPVYARLRYGQEYSGDWIVSSPRTLQGRWTLEGPPQWSLLLCSSISNKHGGFIGKSWIKGKNSRKRWRDQKIKGHTLWMEVYGSENHRTDGNYKLGNRWTQWFILEIICNQHIIRDFPDHLWFPVFFWQKKAVVVWKPRPTTSCPDKTRWFGTSMWQIRSGGRGHIPIPSKAVR